jgi:DNA-binding beta-propeller fold protein YncE
VAGDYLLVAMAGLHQIWALDRRTGAIGIFAGSGREAIDDGPFAEATFAQPSGLALAGARLFVADSESSAVRVLDLEEGEVRTLVGAGLFDFGDRDGRLGEARLQHPIGIAVGPHGLLVADTYNHKLKRVDPTTERVSTWFETADGCALREPAGVAQLPDGRVVVADTNQHRLVEIARDRQSARVIAIGGERG